MANETIHPRALRALALYEDLAEATNKLLKQAYEEKVVVCVITYLPPQGGEDWLWEILLWGGW